MPINSARVADVVVIGSGAAGMSAAIAAHDAGAEVILIEASDKIGGTSAWSGGAAWIPLNRFEREAGIEDSREQVMAYMRHCAEGSGNEAIFGAYLDSGSEVMDYLLEATPLKLTAGTMPDYHGGTEGGIHAPGESRSVAPDVFDLNRLGAGRDLLRRSPHGAMPFSFAETEQMGATIHPERIDVDEYQKRVEQGLVGWGEALAAGLFAGVLDRGIVILTNIRAQKLLGESRVYGVEAEGPDGPLTVTARRGVVLATGGFEWNEEAMAKYFPVVIDPATVPTNRGDGLTMAKQVGAKLGNMSGLWGWPSYEVPGELQADGRPIVRTSLVERLLPHLICVNGKGERFVDETWSYHMIVKRMIERDGQGKLPNVPAWHIFDRQFREKYAFGPVMPGGEDPAWLRGFGDLESLANSMGVPAKALIHTVAKYNESVRSGHDEQFNRGSGGYAEFFGDREQDHPNLGTIEQAPFYAVEMKPATIGTCGGPEFDVEARVLREDGEPIRGLFAAGNVTAAFSGSSYFGPGCTLGAALIFGVLAGRNAAREETANV